MSHQPLTKENFTSVVGFFRKQFKTIDNWCVLDELENRIKSKFPNEVVGVVETEDELIIGAVIAYRNPFSKVVWTHTRNCC